MTYTLSETEQATVGKIDQQIQECQSVLDQATHILRQQQSQMTTLLGAKQGIVLLIANQQDFMKSGNETLQLSKDGKELKISGSVETIEQP